VTSWSWTRRIEGPRTQRNAAAQLLVHCVGPAFDPATASRLATRTSPDIILALADYHGVAGLAYERLRELDAAAPFIADLHVRYTRAVQGHMRIMWELAHLQPVLDATGARWAVIKGPVAVEVLYGSPGQRAYQDLDLLVEPRAFRDVLAALQDSGSELLDRNWTLLRRDLLGEVHLRLPGGTPLDLHWNLINMNRGRMWIDTSELLERSTITNLGGVTVGTLEPVDFVTHLAVHAALSGGDRLMWLKDLERAAVVLDPSWESVVERARRWGVAAGVGLMLARTRDVLGAPIPKEVPARLLTARSARLVRLTERASPWDQSVGRLTAASHIVSRAISHGPLRAVVWFVRRALSRLDPREPAASSVFTPSGDVRDREAYFDAVVSSGRGRQSVSQ
jgi:hypothetical protein